MTKFLFVQLLYCIFHGYWFKDDIWISRRRNFKGDYIDLSGEENNV